MPLPSGGRAEKLGNEYEKLWTIVQFIQLLNERSFWVMAEAVGPFEEGVDLWVKEKSGEEIAYQCKARNGSKEAWSINDLISKGILRNARHQLDLSSSSKFVFVSGSPTNMLRDLAKKARNFEGSAENFYKYEIGVAGKEVQAAIKNIAAGLAFRTDVSTDSEKVFSYLRRLDSIHFADDRYTQDRLRNDISNLFDGDPTEIIALLKDYIIDNLGKRINANHLYSFLASRGHQTRRLSMDTRIIPKINELRRQFIDAYKTINNTIIPRAETSDVLRLVEEGKSIIVHGRAGYGKSGCLVELAQKLSDANIMFLPIRLDDHVPKESAELFGKSLGFPTSPIHCLNDISPDRPCVLLLDQLDSIRWKSTESGNVWNVCKELFAQVEGYNKHRTCPISIIVACRTFDLENDSAIKALISDKDSKKAFFEWKNIAISLFEQDIVQKIVGEDFSQYTNREKELLRIPSNLYIWTKLKTKKEVTHFGSSAQLLNAWWSELREQAVETRQITNDDVILIRDRILGYQRSGGVLAVPGRILRDVSPQSIRFLESSGLILSENDMIRFTHQSYGDFFHAERILDQINKGIGIEVIIGAYIEQTPSRRYQLQIALQMLADEDQSTLLRLADEILRGKSIRFYFKHLVLEVLGQIENITPCLASLAINGIQNAEWSDHFYTTIFLGHKAFVRLLINNGLLVEWIKNGNEERQNGAINCFHP